MLDYLSFITCENKLAAAKFLHLKLQCKDIHSCRVSPSLGAILKKPSQTQGKRDLQQSGRISISEAVTNMACWGLAQSVRAAPFNSLRASPPFTARIDERSLADQAK